MSKDQEREAFEAWARADTTLHLDRDANGYADMTVELLWHAWQARAAMAAGEPVALLKLRDEFTALYESDASPGYKKWDSARMRVNSALGITATKE